MLRLVEIIFLLTFSECGAAQLPQSSDGWIVIDVDTQPSIQCNVSDPSGNVTWSIVYPNDTVTVIGSCVSPQSTCQSSDPDIELSRTAQESLMKIARDHWALSGTSVRCEDVTSPATSKIRVIKRGTIEQCENTENATDWTVNCRIEGAFSSDNTYSCKWYLSDTATETPFIRDPAPREQRSISGHCNITRQLPTVDGVYTYELLFHPGPRAAQMVANVTIHPPSPPVITGYNTSHVLTAGDSVSLTCTVSGGKPPITSITFYCTEKGQIKYDGIFDPISSSNTVKIDRVNASDNGSGCVCTGKWHSNPKRHFERAVRLKVAAAEVPRVEVLTLNGNKKSLTVSVGDNSPVILGCGASGRPKPSIRVVRVDTGQPLEVDTSHTSAQDENVQQYTLTTSARCQDATIYICHASNKEGADEKNITLFVDCTGKDVASQFPLAVVAGGAGAAVVLVIIIVIVVIVVKRRKGTKSESTETERNHIPVKSDDEFEEHINIVYESSDDVVLTTQPQTGASKPPTSPLRVHPFTKPTDKDEQETSFGSVTLNGEKPTENCSAPGKSDRRVLISQYTDVADAYSTVDDDGLTFFAASSGWKFIPQSTAGLSSDYADVDAYSSVDDGREDFLAGQTRCQTDMASDYADADGYSSVKESGPRMETPPQKASGTQDDYAVVNNAGKAAKGSAQPDDYAQVNKTSKTGNPSTAPESEKYAKPKPDVYAREQKSKPRHETDGTRPGPADDDEYNSLNYGDHQPTSKDMDEQYSRIGAPS